MLPKNVRRAARHGVRALILGGLAFTIARLARTGGLSAYIEPEMVPYVKLAALGFALMAAVQLLYAVGGQTGESADCGCNPPTGGPVWKSLILYAAFLIPLVYGLASPGTAAHPPVRPAGAARETIPSDDGPGLESERESLSDFFQSEYPYADPDADFWLGE